jgi:DNA polymerase-3 subunit beta
MRITCHREGLLSACQLVSVAVAARNVNPVLQNVKVIAEKDRCTLMATDTEVGIRMEVRSINVEEPGEALMPANRLLSILREATEEELNIEAGPDGCMLRAQRMEYEMPGEDPSIFPDFPTFAEDKYHEINSGVLHNLVRRTIFAVANPEKTTKWGATTGILWELDGGKARLVATDGRRLALCDGAAIAHGNHATGSQQPVAPLKAMSLLERNLQEDEEAVRVSLRPNEVLIKTERATIYSRLVEGRFPNYKQALPTKHNVKVPLTAGPFQTAVRQAAIMTSEESMGVVFSFEKGKLTLRARGADTGSSRVEMELPEYQASPLEISFDPRYLTDMLRVFEPNTKFNLELTDSSSPAVLRNEPGDYAYVVLPLVVRDASKKP